MYMCRIGNRKLKSLAGAVVRGFSKFPSKVPASKHSSKIVDAGMAVKDGVEANNKGNEPRRIPTCANCVKGYNCPRNCPVQPLP